GSGGGLPPGPGVLPEGFPLRPALVLRLVPVARVPPGRSLVGRGVLHGGRGVLGSASRAEAGLFVVDSASLCRGCHGSRPMSARIMSISRATLTTSPTTTIAGGRMSPAAIASATVPSVAVSDRWPGRVPSWITATGVPDDRP